MIKKRRRGKRPENTDNHKPLREITNTKILPNYSGNPRQDNNEQQSTNYSAKYPRRLDKEGRQFRVNKRRRQEAGAVAAAVTGRQNTNRETVETEEPELEPVSVKQNAKNANEVLSQPKPSHSNHPLFSKYQNCLKTSVFPFKRQRKFPPI